MWLRNWAVGLSWLLALACTSENAEQEQVTPTTVEGCKDHFAAGKGYGYISDAEVVNAIHPSTGGSPNSVGTERRPPTHLERAVAECEAGSGAGTGDVGLAGASGDAATPLQPGSNCNYALLLTRDASVCIARASGFAEELGYSAGIVYLASRRRIVWIIRNTTERTTSSTSGLSMTLDATTGDVLETGAWQGARD